MFFRISLIVLLALIWLVAAGCDDSVSDKSDYLADVAVYADVGSWDVSVAASLEAVRNAGYTVDSIGLGMILSDGLDRYRLTLFPGGDSHEITNALGPVGRMKVKSFVASGGGFIGFGGGSVLADSSSGLWQGIGLFNGQAVYPISEIAVPPQYALTSILQMTTIHPVGRNGSSHYQTLYYGGPWFSYSDSEPVEMIYS